MSGALAEAVEQLVLSGDPDEIVEVLAIRDRLNAKLAVAVGECRANELHKLVGFGSISALLKARAGMTHRDASALSTLGHKLRSLKVIADAWYDATLREGQVKAITAIVPTRHHARLVEHQEVIVSAVAPLSTAETAIVMRDWTARADALGDRPAPSESPDELHLSEILDGRVEMSGSFAAENGATITTAITAAMSDNRSIAPARRRADALVNICEFYLTYHDTLTDTAAALRRRPQVAYRVDLDALRHNMPGHLQANHSPISADDIRRVLGDCDLHRFLTTPQSALLDYGRAQRNAPDALFAALIARDGGCRGRNCDKPPQDCQVHHLIHWEDQGETRASNCGLFCRSCHKWIHRAHIATTLDPDGTMHFTTPHGHTWTTAPRQHLPRPPTKLVTDRPPRRGEPL